MSDFKALCVFGTRPEIIKLWPLVVMARKRTDCTIETCFTGQHGDLGPELLELLDIHPEYTVDVMEKAQSLAKLTSKLAAGLEEVYQAARPDLVLVQGDTTTVMIGALTAFYRRIKVGHVEAGLRTRDKFSPFPEEINRRLVSPLADFHFAPTPLARENLLREGVCPQSIYVTGNTAIDALMLMIELVEAGKVPAEETLKALPEDSRLMLVTAHRRENFGDGIRNICQALKQLIKEFPDVHIVYPVHPNPNVTEPVNRILGTVERIHLIPPRDYAAFVQLMRRANIILTDSGGIQEEAPSLGKPVLVLRDVTERPEGVEAGTLKVVGTGVENILEWARRLLTDREVYAAMAGQRNPYGDGRAAERIINTLLTDL